MSDYGGVEEAAALLGRAECHKGKSASSVYYAEKRKSNIRHFDALEIFVAESLLKCILY
jgi:hypothetical protein